jgi:hypothetical protein
MSKLRDLIRVTPRMAAPATNGHHEHAPEMKQPIVFDAADGKKRILITVNEEGQFEPVYWFGMTGIADDQGRHEAAVIAAHGALICAEESWKNIMGLDAQAVNDGS